MQLEHREWLLHEHRKQIILYAFGGNAVQCPLCKVNLLNVLFPSVYFIL